MPTHCDSDLRFFQQVDDLVVARAAQDIPAAVRTGPSVDFEVLKTVARLGICQELELLHEITLPPMPVYRGRAI